MDHLGSGEPEAGYGLLGLLLLLLVHGKVPIEMLGHLVLVVEAQPAGATLHLKVGVELVDLRVVRAAEESE
jgi:hypothetical protein